jgi:phosphopantothenoylcysteine decarboxylase/phosphopantothenate--cysteine ligase
MGFSLAEEAASRGASVTLVTGPSHLFVHSASINRVDVISAADMHKACLKYFPVSDITIMAAAVSDYTFGNPSAKKIKKSSNNMVLELNATKDILKELGAMKKKKQILAGFALETGNGVASAKEKLGKKNLDLIILNSMSDKGAGFKSPTNKITIIFKDGKMKRFPMKTKQEVAGDILNAIHELI